MNELQVITDAWGYWFAKRNGLSLHFTASTKYSGNWHLDPYHRYEVEVTPLTSTLRFGSPTLVNSNVGYKDKKTIKNDSSTDQITEIDFSYDRTDTFKWSVTEALKVGVSVKGGVEVPLLAKAEASASTEISLSSTQETTKAVKHTVTTKLPLKVAPYKKIVANAKALVLEYNSDWQMSAFLQGSVAVRFNEWFKWNTPEKHALWFIPIETIFSDVIYHNIIDASGYQVVNGGVHAIARGTCSSLFSNSIDIDIKEGNLDDDLENMTTKHIYAYIEDDKQIDETFLYSFNGTPGQETP
ncbi:ETX/MTX2 family pore-forming toxin [Pseudomonas aeruginosa]|nr:ETX/MTX2 family pore-forming toxin [Pseudomonas aeruginosa]